MFFTLILSLQEYLWVSISRIYLMHKLHRYEYKLHSCKLIGLQCANLFSIAYAAMGFYSVTLIASCVLSEREYTQHAKEQTDFCFFIYFSGSHFSPGEASVTYLVFILAELVPFISYLWLNEPHDCFRCLGKDPDRRYSIFQLTRRESLMREH